MDRVELEKRINDLIKKLPDNSLIEAIEMLESLETKSEIIQLSDNLEKVIAEDFNLLKRLAQ